MLKSQESGPTNINININNSAPGIFDKHKEAISGVLDPQKVTNEMKMMTDLFIEKK